MNTTDALIGQILQNEPQTGLLRFVKTCDYAPGMTHSRARQDLRDMLSGLGYDLKESCFPGEPGICAAPPDKGQIIESNYLLAQRVIHAILTPLLSEHDALSMVHLALVPDKLVIEALQQAQSSYRDLQWEKEKISQKDCGLLQSIPNQVAIPLPTSNPETEKALDTLFGSAADTPKPLDMPELEKVEPETPESPNEPTI